MSWAVVILPPTATSAEAPTEHIRVGVYDMDPLTRTGPEGKESGFFVDVLDTIARQERWEIDYFCGSLDECLDKLESGDLDIVAAAPYSKHAALEFDFNRETVLSTWGQVYCSKDHDMGSLLDVSERMVGVVRDDPYNQDLRETLKRFDIACKFVEFNHSEEVLKAVEKGWVDAGVVDRIYGARHRGDYDIKSTSIILSPVELRFAAARGDHQKLIDALDYHLRELKRDPDSVYYELVNQVFGMPGAHGVSRWLVWGIGIAVCLFLIAGSISLILKRQVRLKTAQLSTKNQELDKEIVMRRDVQDALSQSEARYRSLVENTLDGYFVAEYPSGEIQFLNQRAYALFGYVPEETGQMSLWDFVSPKDREAIKERIRVRLKKGASGEAPFICTAVQKDGSTFTAETSASIVTSHGKTSIQGTVRDITEQERLKHHLQHAEKMEAIGTLAGGVAHDFNNLLMGILGNASLMRLDLDPSHPHYKKLQDIEAYVQSGSSLTQQLLGFARGGKYEVRALDLNEVVEKTSHMFGRTKKEIRIHAVLEEDFWTVAADQNQIEQVLLNMYVNALHAMPAGGDLYLKTENITIGEGHIRAQQGKGGRFVRISITDTGVGMDEETRKRIFEPFFTTKEMGRGTGLGLASSYGIIKNHGGFIDVYSEKGKGTTFCIYLPAVASKTSKEAAPVAEGEIEKGTGTVLVVDDEEVVVDVGASILEKIGYDVLVARSGEEALRIYGEKEALIDMVILDMIMPGMGGGETFDLLKQIDPSVKVLLSSGYSINAQVAEILGRGCRGFIQKPFTLASLSRKLREVASDS